MKKILLLLAFIIKFSIVQASLQPGDIVVLGFNSIGDDQITIMATRTFSNESFGITDAGMMDNGHFRQGEGYLLTRTPMSMIAGQILNITLNDGSAGTAEFSMTGNFDLAISGDQILIFTAPYESGICIYALNYNAKNWIGRDDSSSTSLPQGLIDGYTAVCLINRPSYRYAQALDLIHEGFLSDLGDFNNWRSSLSPMDLVFSTGSISRLGAGDFSIIGYNDKLSEEIVFLALRNLNAGTSIKITDKGWNGVGFYSFEGTLTYIVPPEGLKAGQVIKYSSSNADFYRTERFGLSTAGDQLIVYQGPESNPRFIYALNTRGSWAGTATSAQTSMAPPVIGPNGIPVVIAGTQEQGNGYYNGTHIGTYEQVLTAIADPENYVFAGGYNQMVIPEIANFTIKDKADPVIPIPSFKQCAPFVSTASKDQNYILTRVFKSPGIDTDNLIGRTNCEVNEFIQYFDGLGRPLQTIMVNASPGFADIVQPIAYDGFGREDKKYQPYAVAGNNGVYRSDALLDAQLSFYANQQPGSSIMATQSPFSKTVFEASPLNRILEQGAPGDTWQPVPNNGHTLKMDYGTNALNEVKSWTINATTNGASAGWYLPAKLYKSISKDENWQPGDDKAGTSEEFKDFEGNLVLKRVWETNTKFLSTYYVYDDLGNLRYVLPPAVNENGQNVNNFEEGQDVFNQFIYGYHYDGRKRLIEKKIPGKGWEYLVYNKLDQVVLTQDAVQAAKPHREWLFNKYDVFGRIIMTGLFKDESTPSALQNSLNNETILRESRSTADYSNDAFPRNNYEIYTVSYYDNYNFDKGGFAPPAGAQVDGEQVKGLQTGSRVLTLGTTLKLLTVNYYDEKGQMVQSKAENHLGGTDVIENTYNFGGELTESIRTHIAKGKTTIIANRYEYDHMGRKLAIIQSINGDAEVVITKLDYNELGQLSQKNLHSLDGNNFLQNTKFIYNERGWLKSSISDQFSFQLNYQDAINVTPQYNGNISNQLWGPGNNPSLNTFSYNYDKLNRLANANSPNLGETVNYDLMGNITSLTRDNFGTNTYTGYIGNQLTQINGFTTSNYVYDENGSLKSDSQKNINLSYNYLNLPTQVSGSQNITFTYDAVGQKLKKVSGTNITDYIDGIQYNNGAIEFIQTEEGIARRNGTDYSYEYNLTDHLGNVRATFYKNPNGQLAQVIQRDDYYAFGLRKIGFPNSNINKYLYNGKELQEELGEYDYGARFYNPIIGRWSSVDPLAEDYDEVSAYNYGLNNPGLYIDPDGRGAVGYFSTLVDGSGTVIDHINDDDHSVYQLINGQKVKIGTEKHGVDYTKLIGRQLTNSLFNVNVSQLEDVQIKAVRNAIPSIPITLIGEKGVQQSFFFERLLSVPINTVMSAISVVNNILEITKNVNYTPPPRELKGFPTAKRVPNKGRARWKTSEGNILEWDSQHGDVEVYDKQGKHQGSANPETGEMTKDAIPGRTTRK